jgi:hypothetical protein
MDNKIEIGGIITTFFLAVLVSSIIYRWCKTFRTSMFNNPLVYGIWCAALNIPYQMLIFGRHF